MAEPSQPLLEQQRWAKIAIKHLLAEGDCEDAVLWGATTFGTSSMFSGACYPERALQFIEAARKAEKPGHSADDTLALCVSCTHHELQNVLR